MSELILVKAASLIEGYLRDRGIMIEQFESFVKFEKTAAQIRKADVSEQFQLSKFELFEENAFWVKFSSKGKGIGVLAVRWERLGKRSLADHWKDQQVRLYPKPNKIGKKHSPAAHRIHGDVCYSGEFFLHRDFRGKEIAGLMVFYVFILARLRWNMDWIYGLMSHQHAMRGFAMQCGFTISEIAGTHWKKEPSGVSQTDHLVAVDRDNIVHRANIIAEFGVQALLPK